MTDDKLIREWKCSSPFCGEWVDTRYTKHVHARLRAISSDKGPAIWTTETVRRADDPVRTRYVK